MGLFDRAHGAGMQRPAPVPAGDADDAAIARYRYMLRTAPPETVEQAHAEAFAKLTPEQRRKLLDQLAGAAPDGERTSVMRAGDAPEALARAATRAEIRQPGAMERMFGGAGGATPGFGSFLGPAFLGSLAGTVLGSLVAQHFLAAHPPSDRTLADLSGGLTAGDARLGDIDAGDAGTAADDLTSAADADFGDAGDFDLGGDTFDA
jgi:hypothetical protein